MGRRNLLDHFVDHTVITIMATVELLSMIVSSYWRAFKGGNL